jgi:hypothetical protein
MPDTLTAELSDRITRGATYLDENAPEWAHCINLDTFNFESPDSCVIGQLYGGYLDGCRALGLPAETDVDLGFDTYVSAAEVEAPALDRLWRDLIAARQGV